MEKLRRVLSGQDDEEQGLTAQVSPGPREGRRQGRLEVAPELPGLSTCCHPLPPDPPLPQPPSPQLVPRPRPSGARPSVASPGAPGLSLALFRLPGLGEGDPGWAVDWRLGRRARTPCSPVPAKGARVSSACLLFYFLNY